MNWAAPPVGVTVASYLSCQAGLPVAASRQAVTSWLPWRAKTKSLSPTSAGVATPRPTGVVHFGVSSLGQLAGALKSATWASRFGPRHWGQSAAKAAVPMSEAARIAIVRGERVMVGLLKAGTLRLG